MIMMTFLGLQRDERVVLAGEEIAGSPLGHSDLFRQLIADHAVGPDKMVGR